MRRIIKLTPAAIQRIIVEEKEKLQVENKQKLLEQLRLLKKIKNRQINSLSEAKQLHNMKKKLIKSIKGEK